MARSFQPTVRRLRFILWICIAIAASGVTALLIGPEFRSPPSSLQNARSLIKARFALIDQQHRPVTEKSFSGKWLLVFFGFTNCPDVCPTALGMVSRVMDLLGTKSPKLKPLFVTLDPDRDTAEVLDEYVSVFASSIVGLTGTPMQIKEAAKSFRVYYARVTQDEAPDGYGIDHSALLYLIGPDGKFVAHFLHQQTPEEVAKAIEERMAE